MKFFDLLNLALRNLRESKLRVALTAMGVIVGVAMIVTMVSFGLGLQRNTVQRFRDLDLFNEITVNGRDLSALVSTMLERPPTGGSGEGQRPAGSEGGKSQNTNDNSNGGSEAAAKKGPPTRALDDAALAEIAQIPGVGMVEPTVTFAAYLRANGRTRQTSVGGALVPNAASRFRGYAAGRMINSADAEEAVVDEKFVRDFGFAQSADAVGQTIELLAPPDARRGDGARGRRGEGETGDEGLSFFGLPLEDEEAGEPDLVARRIRIAGVLKDEIEGGAGGGRRFRGMLPVAGVYVPLKTAKELAGQYSNPLNRVAYQVARQSGLIKEGEADSYSSAVVRVNDPAVLTDVRKRLTKLGFNSFSIVDQLEEIRTFFLIVNSALGLLGGISLLVASFGIANTMIMSILERTREIGIMKAIGAEDREIKLIFFVEAGLIGLVGGVVGALAAWGIDAVANRLAYRFLLQPRGVTYIDFFSLPPLLWLGAILFAVVISIVAALYPAARAARIDPVKALTHD
ncbi:MAG: ABC transporter permease [Pyrinomonadaceae bacterium]